MNNVAAPLVLVVEDDDFNRSVLIRHLKGEGYERH